MIHGTPQIFHNIKAIFIHIPKTAGTSIERTLGNTQFGGHSYAKTIKKKYPEEWNNYYKFTIVRDPFTRFASAYYYLKQKSVHPALLNNNIHISRDINDYIQNYFSLSDTLHMKPQVDFISEEEEILVDTYPYEDLENSWISILSRLSLNFIPLPVFNKSNTYKINYDSKSISILEEMYKEDFKLLNGAYKMKS